MSMRILSDTVSRAGRLLEVCTVLGFAAGTTAYAQDRFDDSDLQLVKGIGQRGTESPGLSSRALQWPECDELSREGILRESRHRR